MDEKAEAAVVAIINGVATLIPIPGVGAAVSVAAKPLVGALADLLDGEDPESATIAQLEAVNNQLKNLPPLPGGED